LYIQKVFFALLLLATSITVQAQPAVEMADQFRADGKIRVVVGVIVIIFAGLLVYMIRLDRKVKKLEEDQNPS
jgi:heme/copper-type cytochrome/quinol oxidase subunit 2